MTATEQPEGLSDGRPDVLVVICRRNESTVPDQSIATADVALAGGISHVGARSKFLGGRRLLRAVLHGVLGWEASQAVLEIEPGGRPRLPAVLAAGLQFSISHSRQFDSVAVSFRGAVGLDIEEDVPPNIPETADILLSADQAIRLRELPLAERGSAFLRAWTRKEAVLKAVGVGFAIDPAKLFVPFDESSTPIRVDWPGDGPGTLWVRDIRVHGLTGAVCLATADASQFDVQVAVLPAPPVTDLSA
ncbi:4'-phosphopantetheinyl transferase family protein [Alsobacter sp. R-9]